MYPVAYAGNGAVITKSVTIVFSFWLKSIEDMKNNVTSTHLVSNIMTLSIPDTNPTSLADVDERFIVFYSSVVDGELWCPVHGLYHVL